MRKPRHTTSRFVVCVSNSGYPASLELHKIYRVVPDETARSEGDIRVVDESGEDYLYPALYFAPITGPAADSRMFGLLSDATRLRLLKMLSAGPKNVTALCELLGLKQPTISYHIGLLRMGRLVIGTRKGKSMAYTTNSAALKELAAGIGNLTPRKHGTAGARPGG
jgi:DNA-binding transcriptional ArsR family regulator